VTARRRRSAESTAYRALRTYNDVRAIQRGRVGRRILRRVYGRTTGRLFGRLFR
jgi:hypothetical protein